MYLMLIIGLQTCESWNKTTKLRAQKLHISQKLQATKMCIKNHICHRVVSVIVCCCLFYVVQLVAYK
jgi:dolichol kinase